MIRCFLLKRGSRRLRRGNAIPFVAVGLPVIVGFTALAVDYGYLQVAKAQLQNATDAAALAGTSAYFTDARLRGSFEDLAFIARSRASAMALSNKVLREGVQLADADITLGKHDFNNPTGPMTLDLPWNAVDIVARRTDTSANGPIPLFFARIFGQRTANVITHARAVMSDRVAGYRLYKDGIFAPFAIHEQLYQYLLENGPDTFTYNPETGAITVGSADGIREIRLYPWKWPELPEMDGSDGAGNFGTLTVGLGSQGTSFLEEQILHGITAQELRDAFGTDELVFYDAEHTEATGPRIYMIPGNPGLSVGLADAVRARTGDVIGFFIHRGLVETGSTAQYKICNIAFGRVMAIKLTGAKTQRSLTIQPAAYFDEWIRIDDAAPSTNGRAGHVWLVQ